MWKSDDEESNLLESVVNWAHPETPTSTISSTSVKTASISMSPGVSMPPLPPPSPFSELFPQELLQSSGLLLSQFDDDVIGNGRNQQSNPCLSHPSATGTMSTTTTTTGAYRCAECKFSTDDRRLLMCHKRSKHAGEKTFSCPDCSAKFTRQYSLKKHTLQKHPSASANPATQLPKYCSFPNCKYSTKNPISMQLHKRTHQQLYYCKECNARYTRRQSLLGHLTKHHGSNAALIGMRPSPAIANVMDDQSLQSPPPPTTTISSATIEVAGQREQADDSRESTTPPLSPEDNGHATSAAIGTSGAASESINDVVGSVVATALDSRFYCDKCEFTATSLRRLYAHKLSSHRATKEKMIVNASHQICPHCPRKFATMKRMLTHVKKIHTAASIKKQRRRSPRKPKRAPQPTKRRQPPSDMSCDQCDFVTSKKRIFAAHVKSHASEPTDARKTDAVTSSANPMVNSPSYASAVSPSVYDFYHNVSGTRQNGSGSSTHSNNSIGETPMIGQFFVVNRNSSSSSTNSFSSDNSGTGNGRLIRLDLGGQNGGSGLDEMATCVQGLQQANGALMQLLRRRENELRSLRSNVVELLRILMPNNQAFHHLLTLDNVDEMVTNALSRVMAEMAATSQK